uniref:Ionotropic glutamate receptor C-terminal domain-containing protein n=1 Tax=Anopheles albimanus TaxID=7167 RepID=A0A182FGR2_ANOAL
MYGYKQASLVIMDATGFGKQNRFTGQEYWFNWNEQQNGSLIDHYFPNKLSNLHGYQFRLFGIYEFPYLIDMGKNRTAGVLHESLRYLFERQLNGTISVTHEQRIAADATFAYTDFRLTYMHDVTMKERIGSCIVCPFHTERDILGHLLKPFSVGIWLLVGGVLIIFRLLGLLFPRLFPRNLLSVMMFSESVTYRLPFPTRILSFATTVFVFFLSEAYNAKIISLMALPASYERPETLAEFKRSDLKIAIPGVRTQLLRDELPGKLLNHRRAQELYEERQEELYSEYCTVMPWYQALLFSSSGHQDPSAYQLYLLQEQVIERFLALQLAINSPFYPTFVEFFERYFQSGIWMYRVEWIRNGLASMVNKRDEQFDSVVFHFEDLSCIWALIVVGWVVSSTVFLGEMVWNWSQTSGKTPHQKRECIIIIVFIVV